MSTKITNFLKFDTYIKLKVFELLREIAKVIKVQKKKKKSKVFVILYIYTLAKLFLFLIYELKYEPDQRNVWRDLNFS